MVEGSGGGGGEGKVVVEKMVKVVARRGKWARRGLREQGAKERWEGMEEMEGVMVVAGALAARAAETAEEEDLEAAVFPTRCASLARPRPR
ncbi:hypothetical protein CYMTET_12088 [Cymbomonas tetramitiformis]|uniref:Uncharacterized protein n=1 Tax=Cymbomonas tetramitiformis TaxID=36881 RepID=A0AAE0LCH9_9CHLO|nr:hypothetical protein CYMTET_12088 [Cymbomonas tetramitiformis]